MKKLKIPYINSSHFKDVNELIVQMEGLENVPISCKPWPEFSSETKAGFSIAHDRNSILLKYQISEKYLIANEVNNGNIHNDSCVEFFIAFNSEKHYYNLEFNCLGFTKIGYGNGRINRQLLALEVIRKLGFSSRINSNLQPSNGGFDWQILLVIPKEVFVYHQISSFDQVKARGNFYKCGDGLPEPHFLSWNMVHADQPDFHRLESFGKLEFL
ncbi:carbohydrate-binding family 9-like protein [Pedobacter sp. GR22-6]|uniref:carbohydrate-binding family 9-like protein n=1 Tax=Pedobacter sp. GR22-6 TaxID=3127957 RepID=UPI00307F8975